MTTYTLIDSNGDARYTGLTLERAAQEILGHGGAEYELRFEPRYDAAGEHLYVLFGTTRFSREMTEYYGHDRQIMAYAATEGAAWPKIAGQVVLAGWLGHLEAMTDEAYDAAIQAEAGQLEEMP